MNTDAQRMRKYQACRPEIYLSPRHGRIRQLSPIVLFLFGLLRDISCDPQQEAGDASVLVLRTQYRGVSVTRSFSRLRRS